MTNAETRDWIRQQAEQQADAYCRSSGRPAPSTRAERKQIQSQVKAAFHEKFGAFATLFWLFTIAKIVLAVLEAMYGQAEG